MYLTLALHTTKPILSAEAPRRCWPRCGNASKCVFAFCCWGAADNAPESQLPDSRGAGAPNYFQQHVEGLICATLGNDGFVTPASLMAGFPREADSTHPWMRSVQQRAGIWHHVAESMKTEDEQSLDKKYTERVDLVVALALLLGANKSSFEFDGGRGKGMEDTLIERHKHVVLNKLQDTEAEKVLRTSLEQCLERKVPDTDIALSRYSLGKFFQHRVSFVHD